jgi:hypothetical protein
MFGFRGGPSAAAGTPATQLDGPHAIVGWQVGVEGCPAQLHAQRCLPWRASAEFATRTVIDTAMHVRRKTFVNFTGASSLLIPWHF